MTTQINTFKAEELCSRKLWEIVQQQNAETDTRETLEAALEELAERRHYLQQLKNLGIFNPGTH
jgi:hypothetical protein